MRLKAVGFQRTKLLAPAVGIAAGTGMLLSVGTFQEERGRRPPPSPILPFGGVREEEGVLPPPSYSISYFADFFVWILHLPNFSRRFAPVIEISLLTGG